MVNSAYPQAPLPQRPMFLPLLRPWPLVMLLFFWAACALPLTAQELSPEQVTILGQLASRKISPQLPSHQFDPRRPGKTVEPYAPDFALAGVKLPAENGLSVKVSWLASVSSGLAGTLMGAQGSLEAGVSAYEAGDYAAARARFQLLLDKAKGRLQEHAAAWQAWTLFKLEEMDASFELAQGLTQAQDPEAMREGFYLVGLHHLRSSNLKALDQAMTQMDAKLPVAQRDFRLQLLRLTSLVQNRQWPQAKEHLTRLPLAELQHSPYFGLIKEMEALTSYHQNEFSAALAASETARSLAPAAASRSQFRRMQAWLHYFSGNYPESLRLAGEELSLGLSPHSHELTYLMIAAKTRAMQPEGLADLLHRIPKESPFYGFAAFYLKAFGKDLTPDLTSEVNAVEFEFPALRFYAALLEGHQLFLANQPAAAEDRFLAALAVDSNPENYWLARYDLGLIDLKQARLAKAQTLYAELLQAKEPSDKLWAGYHLLFADYQLAQAETFLQHLPLAAQPGLPPDALWEIKLMEGATRFNQGQTAEALAAFQWGWQQQKRPQALGLMAELHYRTQQYEACLDLAAKHPDVRDLGLLQWRVKSLLALNRLERANRVLEDAKLKGDELLDLQVEVWLLNKDYEKITRRVTPLLQAAKSDAQRLKYRRILGNAAYNLPDYPTAESHFQAALALAKTTEERSQTHYDLALAQVAAQHHAALETHTQAALKEPLTPEARYRLTLLLANHYLAEGRPTEADQLLADHAKATPFQRNAIRLRQAQNLYERGDYADCATLAQAPLDNPQGTEARDMAIWDARCSVKAGQGKQVLARLEKELLSAQGDYRKAEVTLLLAEARHLEGGYAASEEALNSLPPDLPPGLAAQTRLLRAKNLFQQGRFAEGDAALGKLDPYREINAFEEALTLQTELKASQGATQDAVKNYLRMYYKKGTPLVEKQRLLLKIAGLYQKQGQQDQAQEYLGKINLSLLDAALKPDYDRVKAALAGKP